MDDEGKEEAYHIFKCFRTYCGTHETFFDGWQCGAFRYSVPVCRWSPFSHPHTRQHHHLVLLQERMEWKHNFTSYFIVH